jgi:hypothetical protein
MPHFGPICHPPGLTLSRSRYVSLPSGTCSSELNVLLGVLGGLPVLPLSTHVHVAAITPAESAILTCSEVTPGIGNPYGGVSRALNHVMADGGIPSSLVGSTSAPLLTRPAQHSFAL